MNAENDQNPGLRCPQCGHDVLDVKDSRPARSWIRRRRRCARCDARFTTREMIVGDADGMVLVTPTGRLIPLDLNMGDFADKMGSEIGAEIAERLKQAIIEAIR